MIFDDIFGTNGILSSESKVEGREARYDVCFAEQSPFVGVGAEDGSADRSARVEKWKENSTLASNENKFSAAADCYCSAAAYMGDHGLDQTHGTHKLLELALQAKQHCNVDGGGRRL